jgi:hypothetical protein
VHHARVLNARFALTPLSVSVVTRSAAGNSLRSLPTVCVAIVLIGLIRDKIEGRIGRNRIPIHGPTKALKDSGGYFALPSLRAAVAATSHLANGSRGFAHLYGSWGERARCALKSLRVSG